MATQGQRRREAVAAIRKLRQTYRKMDSNAEKIERELDRLIKRKTLIGVDSLQKVGLMLTDQNGLTTQLNHVFRDIVIIVGGIPN